MDLPQSAAAVDRSARAGHAVGQDLLQEEQLCEEARFLDWFGQDTVSFNRGYVDIAGGNVLAALWLSYVLERMPQEVRARRAVMDGNRYTFTMTGADCEQATGISRAQQGSCRKHLQSHGLLDVAAQRGKTVTYTVHLDQIRKSMAAQAQPLLDALRQSRASTTHPARARRGR